MRSLINYIREEAATPLGTMGMGNPQPPTDTTPGSEPLPQCKDCKKKKRKGEK